MGKNQRRTRKGKGPKLGEGERLWKRMSSLIANNQRLWNQPWDVKSIAELLITGEKLNNLFAVDAKAERSFRAKLDQTVAKIRKENQYFVSLAERKLRLRTIDEINQIKREISQWREFLELYSSANQLFQGPPNLVNDQDKKRYKIIESSWLSILTTGKIAESLSLSENESITSWGSFNLEYEIGKFAEQRCGFRFPDAAPSIALLLLQNNKISVNELLDLRLKTRKRDGKNPFPRQYDKRLSNHCNQQPEVDADEALAQGRRDLRNLPFVTIDPYDAQDFDDAVCLVKDGEKSTLWVAIADVAHYVKIGTSLDNAARARATSVYLPHVVLPMLPTRLADDLCSLRANVDRLAMVIAMELDVEGIIIETKAYEAVIKVVENLSYENAASDPRLTSMFELAEKWQETEVKLHITNAEMRPKVLDEQQIKLDIKWPNRATKMIESFMVATNSAVGELLGNADAPLPWRCHAPPDSVEVKELNAKLAALGVDIVLPMPSVKTHGQSTDAELSNLLGTWANTTIDTNFFAEEQKEQLVTLPKYLQKVLDPDARRDILDSLLIAQKKASNLDETTRRIVDQGLFQLMQRANYSVENIGHFGLNLDGYVHFTSPIRRYADLATHRQLKSLLRKEEWQHSAEEIAELAAHCSNQSTIAKILEWELVANTYHVHLLRGGEIGSISYDSIPQIIERSWQARVVGLKTPWVFLDLNDDGAIQGRMHLRQMDAKRRLQIDRYGLEIRVAEHDEDSGVTIIAKLGDKYPCRLRGVDIWSGSLDLTKK